MATVIRKSNPIAYKQIEAFSKKLNGLEMEAGWFEGNMYAAEKGRSPRSVASVAILNEFGGRGEAGNIIPPRPFMRPTIIREEANWRDFIGIEAAKIYEGRQTPENMLDMLGLNVAGEIARSITMVHYPRLAPLTIRLRLKKIAAGKMIGNLYKPLVESGQLIRTVAHRVK